MRGDLEKVRCSRRRSQGWRRKKKKVARQRRKEGLPGGWARGQERVGERAEAEQSAAAAPDCLAVVNGWMDRSHFSDENTARLSVRNRVPTLVPPDGRSVGLDHHPRVHGTV